MRRPRPPARPRAERDGPWLLARQRQHEQQQQQQRRICGQQQQQQQQQRRICGDDEVSVIFENRSSVDGICGRTHRAKLCPVGLPPLKRCNREA